MKSTGESWMGTPEAAEFLGLTLRTLYRFIDEGAIPAYKFGRVIRVKRRDVEEFIERSRIEPGELAHLYPPTPLSRPPTPLAFDGPSATPNRSREKRRRRAATPGQRPRRPRRQQRRGEP